MPTTTPLVTVIVRSMDRKTLPETLDSIAAQSYANLETVVVLASGSLHRPLPETWGRLPIRCVRRETPFPRSQAANAGLESARGELICFLDDDDLLFPDHVSTLAALLQKHPEALAAYSKVRAERPDGTLVSVFGIPHDPVSLHIQCYLTIHAVLFRRSAIDAGMRFDEGLDYCEDWDFWLQLAHRGPFVFNDQTTALYRIHPEGGFGIDGDSTLIRAAEIAVYNKWRDRLPDGILHEIFERARAWRSQQEALAILSQQGLPNHNIVASVQAIQKHYEALSKTLATLSAERDALRSTLEASKTARNALNIQLRDTVSAYESSLSWRITKPLRSGGALIRRIRKAMRGFHAMSPTDRIETLGLVARGNLILAKHKLALAAHGTAAPNNVFCVPMLLVDRPQHPPLPDVVDILIPVFNGMEYLPTLFESIARGTTTPFRLLICDDASTDPQVWLCLQEQSARFPGSILLRNSENLGFVLTINRLFEQVEHNFVLVNTDVEVPPGWLERLMQPLLEDASIASVTPFTNAGTICSFPRFFEDNPLPEGATVESVDRQFARLDKFIPYEIPTAVGFCTAIRLDTARQIGMFDTAFAEGYGEENDWSMRALAAGFRHVLVPNLFVYHKHGGSFSSTKKQALLERNWRILRERYPNIMQTYQNHISRDPARPLREFLGLLVAASHAGRPVFVVVDNAVPGGAHIYRNQLVYKHMAAGDPVLLLIDDFQQQRYWAEYRDAKQHIKVSLSGYEDWGRLLAGIHVGELFFNNAYSYRHPTMLAHWLGTVANRLGIPLTLAVHDYFMVCPSLFLIDWRKKYCGIPDIADCERCIPQLHTDFPIDVRQMREWREAWGSAVNAATRVLVFSRNTSELFQRAYPGANGKLEAQPHSMEAFAAEPIAVDLDQPLHVGIVGSIAWHKGWPVVRDLCQLIDDQELPYLVTIIGELHPPFTARCLRVTGRYNRLNLPTSLKESGANVFLFPSIWPETFSYIVNELIACAVPVCCFDLGAPAEWVDEYSRGRLLSTAEAPGLLIELEHFLEDLRIEAGQDRRKVSMPTTPMPQ